MKAREQVAVGHVQLEHVEAAAVGHPRAFDEGVADAVHVGAVHRLRGLVRRRPGDLGDREDRPVAVGERGVEVLPAELGRALGAGVAELQADLGVGLGVDEVDDALPGGLGLRRVGAGAAGADAALGGDAGHLGVDEAGAALGALAEVDEVPVGRDAVDGLVLGHRRDDDAVLELQSPELEGGEHRAAGGGVRADAGGPLEPGLGAVQPVLVAQAQVLVADALRAGEERVGELHGVEVEVALDLLEPLHRVARRRLEAEDVEAAGVLVLLEGGLEGGLAVEVGGEGDGASRGRGGCRSRSRSARWRRRRPSGRRSCRTTSRRGRGGS